MTDVTISHLTLACSSWPQEAKHKPLARARAMAQVGLSKMGVTFAEIPHLREHRTQIENLGVSIPEAEWVNLGTEDSYSPEQAEGLKILAGEFGVSRVNAGVCDLRTSTAFAAAMLGKLAQDAAAEGIMVAVEPVAFGTHPMITDVAGILDMAGNPENAGLLVDVWQVTYPGFPLPLPVNLPVAEFQLCGITRRVTGNAREDSQDRRTLAEMRQIGVNVSSWLAGFGTDAPVSYEVPRSDWREMPLEKVARLVADDLKGI